MFKCVLQVVILPNPLVNAGADLILDCFTGASEIEGSGSTVIAGATLAVSWKKDGQPILLANGFDLSVNQAGVYEMTVRALPSGCFSTDEVNVVDAPKPTGATIFSKKVNCFDQ